METRYKALHKFICELSNLVPKYLVTQVELLDCNAPQHDAAAPALTALIILISGYASLLKQGLLCTTEGALVPVANCRSIQTILLQKQSRSGGP